jgi:hypothetical protein
LPHGNCLPPISMSHASWDTFTSKLPLPLPPPLRLRVLSSFAFCVPTVSSPFLWKAPASKRVAKLSIFDREFRGKCSR